MTRLTEAERWERSQPKNAVIFLSRLLQSGVQDAGEEGRKGAHYIQEFHSGHETGDAGISRTAWSDATAIDRRENCRGAPIVGVGRRVQGRVSSAKGKASCRSRARALARGQDISALRLLRWVGGWCAPRESDCCSKGLSGVYPRYGHDLCNNIMRQIYTCCPPKLCSIMPHMNCLRLLVASLAATMYFFISARLFLFATVSIGCLLFARFHSSLLWPGSLSSKRPMRAAHGWGLVIVSAS